MSALTKHESQLVERLRVDPTSICCIDIKELLAIIDRATRPARDAGGERELPDAEIGPALRRLLNDWLSSDMLPDSKEQNALKLFLWDNKIALLYAAEFAPTSPSRNDVLEEAAKILETIGARYYGGHDLPALIRSLKSQG